VARRWKLNRFLTDVEACGRICECWGTEEIVREAWSLRRILAASGPRGEGAAACFAVARAAAQRTLGIRHRDPQVAGGWGLLHGMAVEMEMGEGKTLTATLPASAAALAGLRVHIYTANDYLARRDAEWMGPIYLALGLRVGVVAGGMDVAARREAYSCDVVYSTAKEVAFDFLRDVIILGPSATDLHLQIERAAGGPCRRDRLFLQGLEFAIVDELDSVLIDEARTPLILCSRELPDEGEEAYRSALAFSKELEQGRHFTVRSKEKAVDLTPEGLRMVEGRGPALGVPGSIWASARMRREAILQAIAARFFFHRDRQYLVRDGKVLIIDENTGRVLPDRAWEDGLHQAVLTKEGCHITPRDRPLARTSYQRFFRRYLHLSGMTGTAREASVELAETYGLPLLQVPPFRPSRRVGHGARVHATRNRKEEAIVNRIREVHAAGRPVLVGTRSVEASERLSRRLREASLPHRVLNARQDREEAETIRRAGQPGSITVATNMAGRGTDIRLHPDAARRGGLHVIASEPHDAARIDRQLYGRCGRQGDPGSHELYVSFEDELLETYSGFLVRLVLRLRRFLHRSLVAKLGSILVSASQAAAERHHRRLRRELLRMEECLEGELAFAGRRGWQGGNGRVGEPPQNRFKPTIVRNRRKLNSCNA